MELISRWILYIFFIIGVGRIIYCLSRYIYRKYFKKDIYIPDADKKDRDIRAELVRKRYEYKPDPESLVTLYEKKKIYPDGSKAD